MNPKLYNEMEELKKDNAKLRGLVERLEARARSLERENVKLRKELEECRKKNEKLTEIITRAIGIAESMKKKETTLAEMVEVLRGFAGQKI